MTVLKYAIKPLLLEFLLNIFIYSVSRLVCQSLIFQATGITATKQIHILASSTKMLLDPNSHLYSLNLLIFWSAEVRYHESSSS